RLRLDKTIGNALAAAMRERRPLDLDDAAIAGWDARALGFAAPPVPWTPLRAAVALPLVFGGRVLGALLVGSDKAGRWDKAADKAVLEEIGVRAATAFENARLYRVLQREIQDRRAAQEELQQSNQRKDEFLAMMSHELRNPLAPIHTAIDVIRKVAAPQPKVTWALDIAQRQLKQMTRLIEELLDVARISQGKITLKREPIDLKAVIAQSVETVQPSIQSRRQTLTVGMPEHAVRLQGDAARLTQVIANLLHNASKYSGEGTQIELLAEFNDGEAVVTVRDQGIGIDAELLPHIFDLFAQGKRGLDRAQGGLGVGLTLARRLTELHGGRIEASSAGQDCGSDFKIRLPCIALLHEVASAPSHASVASAPQRVLVVDDNRDAAEAMATVLEMEGHAVLTAEDGEGALAAIEGFKPTVVLLDIGLPLLDGYAVARQLRGMALTKNALLIALTGYGRKKISRLRWRRLRSPFRQAGGRRRSHRVHPALVHCDHAGHGAPDVLIANDVRRFVLTSIPSVPYREALLLFNASPRSKGKPQAWPAPFIFRRPRRLNC
ncbi:MAG: hybrid sensor histidine kinase/response regulator, partial [Variovorax sp.]